MASIARDKNGTRRIQFVAPDGSRKAIRLGKVSQRAAEAVKFRVEQLLAAKLTGHALEADTAGWLTGLDGRMIAKLAAAGLTTAPEAKRVATLAEFIASYVASRVDVKPATKEVWRQGEKGLVEYFGPDKPLPDITPGEADGYKLALIGKKLAPMTVRKRLQFATMIFRAAVRRRLLAESPFADVSIKAGMPDRSRFVTREETARLFDACPNHHWRAIVALARYGGLRSPSEVLSLRWQDVDWASGRIVVQSPKTEHHPGKATRTIPLFPELREHLETSFELAPEGDVYVVDERMRASAQGKAGWRNCNLRTTFTKIVARAGLTAWPRLFHNLRSSRQTELAEAFPSHVVCEWLGNSEDIARKHYYQVTDDHFAQATDEPTKSGAESGARVAQNPAQQAYAAKCDESHESTQLVDQPTACARPCDEVQQGAELSSGWGGIRTPGTLPYSGFQDRRLRPLGHPS